MSINNTFWAVFIQINFCVDLCRLFTDLAKVKVLDILLVLVIHLNDKPCYQLICYQCLRPHTAWLAVYLLQGNALSPDKELRSLFNANVSGCLDIFLLKGLFKKWHLEKIGRKIIVSCTGHEQNIFIYPLSWYVGESIQHSDFICDLVS